MPEWYKLGVSEVTKELNGDLESGLKGEEAKRRIGEYGPNELKEKKGPPLIFIFLKQFAEPLIIILLIAAAISGFLFEWGDTVVILIVVALNAVLGVSQEIRAERAIAALKRMARPQVTVVRDDNPTRIPSRELVPGDLLLIESGTIIPADGRIVEAASLKMDEAALTGESVAVEKISAPILKEKLGVADQKNMVFMGTAVTYGRGKVLITATGMATELGKIAELIAKGVKERTPLEKRFREIGKWLGLIAIGVCVAVFMAGISRGESLAVMFLTAVSLAVAAVPESLPAVIAISLALGAYKMAKRNAIIRKLPAVETLGCVSTICSDKTGTLTQNKMVVKGIYIGKTVKITGEGYEPKGEFFFEGKSIDPQGNPDLKRLLTGVSLCNDAYLAEREEWTVIGDPTEGALLVAAEKAGLNHEELEEEYPRVSEIPFDSKRKRMTTIHKGESGKVIAFIKGAPDEVLMQSLYIGSDGKPLTYGDKQRVLKQNKELAGGGMRVLGVAMKELPEIPQAPNPKDVEKDLTFLGLIYMTDPPREEVPGAIRVCEEANIKPIMITGDHKLTALSIAKELKLAVREAEVLTGEEMEGVDEAGLGELVEKKKVYARVNPQHKSRIVDAYIKHGDIVAVTGDGVNDAPALKRSHIGVSMGIIGTDVAKEASEMVLADDNFATIVMAVKEGRVIYDNIKKFIKYMLSTNSGEILTMFFSILLAYPLPLLPIHILWVNLVTDGLPALALGAEGPEEDVMRRPPRNPRERIFGRNLLLSITGIGLLMAALTLTLFKFGLVQDLAKARTIAFTVLAFLQMAHVLNCRSEDKSLFKIGFFSNFYLTLAILSTIVLQLLVIYVPFLQGAFRTVALSPTELGIVALVSLIPIPIVELRKLLFRKGK